MRHPTPLTEVSDQSIIQQIQAVCLQELPIHVASPDQDLFAAGVMDSVMMVQLILRLEECFGLMLPMQELEAESFRSLTTIAQLLLSRRKRTAVHTAV